MNSTAAAAQAGVTVATIRTWCRRGAVAATKVARRWVIDAASLARRIAIGAARTAARRNTAVSTPAELSAYCDAQAKKVSATRARLFADMDPAARQLLKTKRRHPINLADRALDRALHSWLAARSAYLRDDEMHQQLARDEHAAAVERQAKADALVAAL